MAKKLYRPDEAAEILSVSRWTIYRWVRDEKLRSTKLGRGSLRIFRDSIEELIRNGADEQRL
ncbi:MAG TPA: DNA-binding protein [Deltaproteobacteria bacterium]|nr:DNA-binding protein [Deltaproteobacteria bacterium]